jgi:hypothetical protein
LARQLEVGWIGERLEAGELDGMESHRGVGGDGSALASIGEGQRYPVDL